MAFSQSVSNENDRKALDELSRMDMVAIELSPKGRPKALKPGRICEEVIDMSKDERRTQQALQESFDRRDK